MNTDSNIKMRFIVFENLKHIKTSVTRVYPIQNMNYFQYDKVNKIFKIQNIDGSWHTITNDGNEITRNEKMFEYLVSSLKEKVTFK